MYSKQAAIGTEPKTIIFYYKKDDFFKHLSLRTLYRAKNIKSEAGEALIDDYAMSEDEKDVFLLFMKQATYDAYDIVQKMTTGITTAPIVIDDTTSIITIVPDGENTTEDILNTYSFKILDEAAFNENALYAVDSGIEKYIKCHVLADWYDLVGLDNEYIKWSTKKDVARIDLITKRLFQLRKPLIS